MAAAASNPRNVPTRHCRVPYAGWPSNSPVFGSFLSRCGVIFAVSTAAGSPRRPSLRRAIWCSVSRPCRAAFRWCCVAPAQMSLRSCALVRALLHGAYRPFCLLTASDASARTASPISERDDDGRVGLRFDGVANGLSASSSGGQAPMVDCGAVRGSASSQFTSTTPARSLSRRPALALELQLTPRGAPPGRGFPAPRSPRQCWKSGYDSCGALR